jgi:hypothetical protein
MLQRVNKPTPNKITTNTAEIIEGVGSKDELG